MVNDTDSNAVCAVKNMGSQSLTSKAGWSSVASICNLVGRLVVQIMIARKLGPGGVGRIAYIMWLVEITNLLTCFGLPNTLTRYIAELFGQRREHDAVRFAQWIFIRYFLFAIVGALTVSILFYCSSQYQGSNMLLFTLMIFYLINALQTIILADLAGRQRFDLLARVNFISTFALLTGVAIGVYGYGVTGVFYGYLIGALIPVIYGFKLHRDFSIYPLVEENFRQRVWKFSFHTWLAMLVSAFVWSRMEIFFLEHYWNAHEVAMFTVALTFANVVQQVANLLGGAFMSHFSHLLGEGNCKLVQSQYESATRLVAFVVVPMAFSGAAIIPTLLPLLFGTNFSSAIPNAVILTATSALAFSMIGSALIYAKERSDFIALSGFVGAIIAVVTNYIVVPHYGAWGAVWIKLFIQTSMIALGTWFIIVKLHFSFPFCSLGRTTVASAFCGISAWMIQKVEQNSITGLLLAIFGSVIVYAFSVRIFKVLKSEDANQLKRISNRMPGAINSSVNAILDIMVAES